MTTRPGAEPPTGTSQAAHTSVKHASAPALQPLEGGQLAIGTLGISIVTMMTVLDTTIANVALPTIAGNLGVSPSQGTWVITFFGVANAIAIPLTGWAARRVGEVRLYLWSSLFFVIASWLCGIAWNLPSLIGFRVLQGLAAGPLIPLSQSLLLACYPREKHGLALGLWSLTIVVGPIMGPILGGYICDNYHWGWIFFINVPVGLITLPVLLSLFKDRETPTRRNPIDTVGLVLLVLGVGCLQIMLDEGKDQDWFASNLIVALFVISLISLCFLVIWELHTDNPVVDLSLFRHRNFTVGTVCISLGFMLYFASVVILPMMLQTQLAYTALWAGLATAPIGFFSLILAPLIGKNAHRLDMRVIVTISFLVFSGCFFWRTLFTPQMDFAFVVWPQLVQGIAVSMFFMPLTNILISGLDPKDMASASSLSNCTRVLCGSIGASFTTTLWERREVLHHTRLTEHLTTSSPLLESTLDSLAGLGMSTEQGGAYLAREVTKQGFVMSTNDIFWLYGMLFIGLAALVWLAKPPFTSGRK